MVEEFVPVRLADEAQSVKGLFFVVLSSLLVLYLVQRMDAAHRRTANTVERTREQLQLAQTVARLGSWTATGATDEVRWSRQLAELLAFDPSRMRDDVRWLLSCTAESDRPRLREALDRLIESDEAVDTEVRMVRGDGEQIWVQIRARSLIDEEGPLLVGTVQDVTAERHAKEQLEEQAGRLESLSRQLLEAQESERRLISTELHDQIGQMLTLIDLILQRACESPDQAPALVGEALEHLGDLHERVRAISLDLRPQLLDDLGPVSALRWLTERQDRAAPAVVRLRSELGDEEIPPALHVACYRIAQEALTNALRHGEATHIDVVLRRSGHELFIEVHDDGCGFDVAGSMRRAEDGDSLGLVSMRERAELADGRLVVESAPGRTTVRAELPMAPA
ncbi:MAG: PAS domain S-box protein [Acidobacteria bacterium]|nr:MAG: PAS domain S-box protein [Acidobacteriota bacterium]